jgi:hypothetical protein
VGLHQDANGHADRLSEPHGRVAIVGQEELVNIRSGFEFPHDTGQGGPVVVQFTLDHPALRVGLIEKRQNGLKRDTGVGQHIGETPALMILSKRLCQWHGPPRLNIQNL